MKTRIKLLILMLLFTGSSSIAQKEVRQVSLKIYLPIQFNAGNYQPGYDTRGRWMSQGIELGLNMKNKRWEHELILGSPVLNETTHIDEIVIDSTGRLTQISYKPNYHTKFSLNYQGAFRVFTNRTKKLNVSLGLGISAQTIFSKSFDYAGNERFIDYRMNVFLLRPHALCAFDYMLSPRWTLNFTIMFGPQTWIYRTRKERYTQYGEIHTYKSAFWNNYSKHLIASRIGFGYLF